jgi:23S rRNA (guanosine2251-2'-O)-methyltransferase
MDGKKGGKGRGFEKFTGGRGGRPQDKPRGGKGGGKPGDGRRYYGGAQDEDERRPFDRDRKPFADRPGRSFREDGGKGPGPRPSRAPERPVPPAVYDGGGRAKQDAPRYGRPAPKFERPAGDAPRYGRPAPKFERPAGDAPRYGRPVPKYERPDVASPETEAAEMDNLLVGRNPIREALKAGRSIEKMLVAQGELSGSARELVAKAREAGIVVQFVDRARLDAVYPNHQGMLAYTSAAAYSSVEEILEKAAERHEAPFIVALDGVTDPHNLGAVIRSAECCGAHGVIVPERRSAGLNPAAVKASAGALSYLPVAKVGNLSRTLAELKDKGLWVIGCDMSGEDIRDVDLTGPAVLVIGSEGEGISRLVLEGCDKVVSIPLKGQIGSLNASVAAGIALYEVMRARSGQ